jgi:hypothetical protein
MLSRADPVRNIDDQKKRRPSRSSCEQQRARRRPDIIWTY